MPWRGTIALGDLHHGQGSEKDNMRAMLDALQVVIARPVPLGCTHPVNTSIE
jgi:hypothetical protein